MRATIALIPLMLLAACGDGATVDKKDASTAEVAKSVADAGIKLKPGRWQLTMTFKKFDIEGMPPAAKQAIEQSMAQGRTFNTCLTKEQADKPDSGFFGQQGEDCRYDTFTMGGGKIDATMTCKGSAGPAANGMKMKMTGTYSAETYDTMMDMNGTAPNGKTMAMQIAMTSKHVGACKGDES